MKKFFTVIGPGFITGAADDDPTAIATYSQSGGKFGYKLLWTALFTTPCMIVVQEMCGRIGIASGKGLTTLIQTQFPKPFFYSVLSLFVVVNLITTGADIAAMGETGQLLLHLPFLVWVLVIISVIVVLQLFVSYKKYANILKYTAFAFLGYVINALIIKQEWHAVIRYTLLPYISFQKDFLLMLVAILGTNISAYLFFWQTGQEVEEEFEEKKIPDIDVGRPKKIRQGIRQMRTDTTIGMVFSNSIVYFVELATAATLGLHRVTSVNTATQAAEALRPFAGQFSFLLFSVGILGSGFLAIPTLTTSSAYVISRLFHWKIGLTKTVKEAPYFYISIAFLTILGALLIFLPIKPFDLLVYAAAFNGILTPVLLIMILIIANQKSIMKTYVNSRLSNILGVSITLLMSTAVILLFYFYI